MLYKQSHESEVNSTGPVKYAIVLAFAVVAFLVMGMQLVLSSMYQGVIYPGVKVAGVSLTGLTFEQAAKKLQQASSRHTVSLQVKDKRYSVSSDELGAQYDNTTTAKAAYMVGRRHWFVPLALLEAQNIGNIGYAYNLDRAAQKKFVQRVVSETGVAPINAKVSVADGKFQVHPDKDGLAVDAERLLELLEKSLANVSSEPIVIEPTVQKAPIKAADTTGPIEQAKQFFNLSVNLSYESRSFKPTAADISQWIVFDAVTEKNKHKLQPRVDESKVKDYVLKVGASINKSPINRKIRIENGVTSEERAGVEGIVIDDAVVTAAIMKAVNDKSTTLTLGIPTKKVAFKTEYNRVVSLDYGRYIEINLSKQRMWVYQDKQVIFQSPITSGATGAGYPTIQGLFSIYNKQTNRSLNGYAIGYDYNVYVKYWMPFSGNFGMHDASWRSNFGGSDYYYGGSHGCVNMPEHAAAFLYGWAPVGTPVWVHS